MLAELGESRVEEFASKWSELSLSDVHRETLVALFSFSDFIFEQALRHEQVSRYLLNHIDNNFTQPVPAFSDWCVDYITLDEAAMMSQLRVYRQLVMVLIAGKDFLHQSSMVCLMRELSELADQFYLIAREWAVAQMAPRWGHAKNQNGENVELIALGMGKLGGFELNFSSDIDLIFCYEEKGLTQGGRRSEDFQVYFTKLAQKVIQLLDRVTPDGRVFRVDMRLRPFGDSGPLVSSFDAVEDYYQEQGREWERYALLKARPLGGVEALSEQELGQQARLMALLKPFVYRRYIDFSVIDSLRNMKHMIEMEVKRRQLTLNIKLGQGGIREVEFIVQAMQMLRGGKEAQLQQTGLLNVLPELVRLRVFDQTEAGQLEQDYLWLRQCEQYLQAFADAQTQTLPNDELNQQRLICLFGMPSWQNFLNQLSSVNARIHNVFEEVIGGPEEQNKQEPKNLARWQQVWLANAEDIEPEDEIIQLVLSVRPDLMRAVSGSRGREKLDLLIPHILSQSEQQNANKEQLSEILDLIKKISSRTTYLELLIENEGALTQLIKLCMSCRFIGRQISKFPLLLDQLIDPKLLYTVPEIDSYSSDLRRYLLRVDPDDLEQQMEVLRQFKLTSQLIISACDVTGISSLLQVSDHLTALAEACIEHGVNLAWQQMVSRYGYPEGASDENKNFAVIAYGKLGGFELGYGSDLDVVFVHNCESTKPTDGKKAIDSRQFYLKLAQRLMHIFTTRTLSGELYEIDTRLRPSGASGLLAIHIDTFADYQKHEAWTWEHQALVRTRLVMGNTELKERFSKIKTEILTQSREPENLRKDITEMRQKMFDNLAKESDGMFDLKQSRGGIADIEFISQYLVLSASHKHPELESFPDNVRIFEQAKHVGLITENEHTSLLEAYVYYREAYHQASLNDSQKAITLELANKHAQNVKGIWTKLLLS